MAILYVAEFESVTPTQEGGSAQVARALPVAEQTLTISNVAASGDVVNYICVGH